MTKIDSKKTVDLIKRVLADHLGIEPDDIDENDNLQEDLHMNPADLTDITHNLSEYGFKVSDIDLTSISTVEELIDAITSEMEIYEN